LAFQIDFQHERHDNHCALKTILSGKINPNAAGYPATPLQIAIVTFDIEGVTEMLEAGGGSNAIGDGGEVSFKTNSILECFQ